MTNTPLTPETETAFTPALVQTLRHGYGLAQLRADALAGLTVAIVALPLSMAIAIASGASPAQGLYTAIIGGFLVSALGGSRYQIGGPAGAFIVLVGTTVALHGMEGLILATFLSGLFLALIGALKIGVFIRYIPFPVVIGFTAGIAVIIFASQIKDLLGLSITDEPREVMDKLPALWAVRDSLTPPALLLSGATIAVILVLGRFRPKWPGLLIAVALASVASATLDMGIETIGTAFGGIPSTLPMPALPSLSMEKLVAVLPAALSFTLLGAIESLLSAVVADSMSGTRHNSNAELVAQGAANMGSALFGGFCVTGTIARTATNVRAGAHSPVAGMLHAVFLLAFILLAAPLAAHIPLAALAGVLAIVAWKMIEKTAIKTLLRSGWGEITVLGVTFLLTVFRDLTEAIIVGLALGALVFMHRSSKQISVRAQKIRGAGAQPVSASDPDIVIYRISGPLFFGATASIGSILDRINDDHKTLVMDFSEVPFLDSTGANMIEGIVHKTQRRGVTVWLTGANRAVLRSLLLHGLKKPSVRYASSIDTALGRIRPE